MTLLQVFLREFYEFFRAPILGKNFSRCFRKRDLIIIAIMITIIVIIVIIIVCYFERIFNSSRTKTFKERPVLKLFTTLTGKEMQL